MGGLVLRGPSEGVPGPAVPSQPPDGCACRPAASGPWTMRRRPGLEQVERGQRLLHPHPSWGPATTVPKATGNLFFQGLLDSPPKQGDKEVTVRPTKHSGAPHLFTASS